LKLNPIGIKPQPPSSPVPEVNGTLNTLAETKVTAVPGAVLGACAIDTLVKLPALKPELIVALVPGQTPLAEVVTVAEGSGYTETEKNAVLVHPPGPVAVT
jgi:hypothetical protein